MDYRSILSELTDDFAGSVPVDQAIFTSIRSPMGEGYRIIAASPGVRAEEKVEITRRAPSHDSLCSTQEDAVAMLVYPLASGRFCVAHSQCAGKEHTGRGGYRIYTHIVLLDEAAYQTFAGNPFAVYAALHKSVHQKPQLTPPAGLDRLVLSSPTPRNFGTIIDRPFFDNPASNSKQESDQALSLFLCQAALENESWLVFGPAMDFGVIKRWMMTLPQSTRRNLAFSVGLKPAPSRQVGFCFVSGDPAENQRALRGQLMKWLDSKALPKSPQSSYEGWIQMVMRWATQGRTADLARLTGAIDQSVTPPFLARVAELCRNIDVVESADADQTHALARRLVGCDANTNVEKMLQDQLRDGIQRRSAYWENELSKAGSR